MLLHLGSFQDIVWASNNRQHAKAKGIVGSAWKDGLGNIDPMDQHMALLVKLVERCLMPGRKLRLFLNRFMFGLLGMAGLE